MHQAGDKTELLGTAEIAYHSQLLLESKKRFENQDMIIRSAKYTKLGVAASMRRGIQE